MVYLFKWFSTYLNWYILISKLIHLDFYFKTSLQPFVMFRMLLLEVCTNLWMVQDMFNLLLHKVYSHLLLRNVYSHHWWAKGVFPLLKIMYDYPKVIMHLSSFKGWKTPLTTKWHIRHHWLLNVFCTLTKKKSQILEERSFHQK